MRCQWSNGILPHMTFRKLSATKLRRQLEVFIIKSLLYQLKQVQLHLVTDGTTDLERGSRDGLALGGGVRPEVLVDLLEPLEGLWRVVAVADELAPRVLDAGAVVVLPGLDAVEELHAHLQVVWLRY